MRWSEGSSRSPGPHFTGATLAVIHGLDRNSDEPGRSLRLPPNLLFHCSPCPALSPALHTVPSSVLYLKLGIKGAVFKSPAWRGDLVLGGCWVAFLGDCRKSTLLTDPCAWTPEGPARQ